jgi:hypothetical protein
MLIIIILVLSAVLVLMLVVVVLVLVVALVLVVVLLFVALCLCVKGHEEEGRSSLYTQILRLCSRRRVSPGLLKVSQVVTHNAIDHVVCSGFRSSEKVTSGAQS